MDETVRAFRQQKSQIIARYARSDDAIATRQALALVILLVLCWTGIGLWARKSLPVLVGCTLGLTLLQIRVFGLLHECGHGSLFKSARLNRWCGFALGVLCGMPQYVWSRHHLHHHATNGDWERHRGTLNTLSVGEYGALTRAQQRSYRLQRHASLAPVAGFTYLLLNPRVNWLKGVGGLVVHVARQRRTVPPAPWRSAARGYRTRYWADRREFWHMTLTNLAMGAVWVLGCSLVGPVLFVGVMVVSISLAGGATIALFASQHNFEHAYASDSAHWDYDRATLLGTSYMVLPGWLNWVTAYAGYHHVHHMSAAIPNYRLKHCHDAHTRLFDVVPTVRLSTLRHCFRFLLWDRDTQRIVAIDAVPSPSIAPDTV